MNKRSTVDASLPHFFPRFFWTFSEEKARWIKTEKKILRKFRTMNFSAEFSHLTRFCRLEQLITVLKSTTQPNQMMISQILRRRLTNRLPKFHNWRHWRACGKHIMNSYATLLVLGWISCRVNLFLVHLCTEFFTLLSYVFWYHAEGVCVNTL